jgi:hypothetical protein
MLNAKTVKLMKKYEKLSAKNEDGIAKSLQEEKDEEEWLTNEWLRIEGLPPKQK